jgi:hypothetical protein
MRVALDVSVGELIDRITILELKVRRLSDPLRRLVALDLEAACRVRDRAFRGSPALNELTESLRSVNRILWDAEEELRECERCADFGSRFVALARLTYTTNDRRAAIKRRIDSLFDDTLGEFKSYLS